MNYFVYFELKVNCELSSICLKNVANMIIYIHAFFFFLILLNMVSKFGK